MNQPINHGMECQLDLITALDSMMLDGGGLAFFEIIVASDKVIIELRALRIANI